MDTEQLKQHIADEDVSAYELLSEVMPTAASRFYRTTNTLAKLLEEVRQHYPEARFYTAGGDGFALILGDTHSGMGESPNQELSALMAPRLTCQGGDW